MPFTPHAPVPLRRPFERGEPREDRSVRDPAAGPAPQAPPLGRLEEHLASLLSPRSFAADQYRVLRQFVEQARVDAGLKVLAVTSPAAGDGKTTTAVNLAATLADSRGCRVLLVDADLRRPFVAANLGLDALGPGLAGAVMDDRLDLDAVVRPTPYKLAVLPAGSPPEDVYGLLESPRVGQLLDEARGVYDYVVLDTPPVLLVPDCSVMARWIDRFLLVVAAHRTPRRLLAEALNVMDPARLLGVVFNGDDRPLSGYYKQYYGGYYHAPRGATAGWWQRWRGRRQARRHSWR